MTESAPGGIDLDAVRADTPGCQHVNHLNNAGAALPPRSVTDTILRYVELESVQGGYEAAAAADAEIESTYAAIAALVGAQARNVALVENATRAWDMAFYGISFRAGDRILTCRSEYASNYLAYLQVARSKGVVIDVIPDNEHGEADVDAAANLMDRRVKLVSITHVPTSGGLVNPAQALGRLAREAGCYYLLDACQSVGQMPIDVEAIGCDFLSSTGRKFLRGPRGTGFLYASERAIAEIEPPFIDGLAASWVSRDEYTLRDDARRFENWEANAATRIALGVAARYAMAIGIPAIWRRVRDLAARLRAALRIIPGVTLRDRGQVQCGIVTFTCAGHEVETVKARLHRENINSWTVAASWTRIDMDHRHLPAVVRASVHYYNSESEIDAMAAVIAVLMRQAPTA